MNSPVPASTSAPVPVHIHPSQFPEAVSRQLADSLEKKRLLPKFHYASYRQAQRWLDLHQAYSPSRKDPGCQDMYDRIFQEAAHELAGKPVQLIGLGCGGGMKDLQLAKALAAQKCPLRYIPCDVSPALALTGRRVMTELLAPEAIRPLVADLLESGDLTGFWNEGAAPEEVRLFSFLGMIPNFPPIEILAILKSWMRPQDRLILSANLLPSDDEEESFATILPQYDNDLTRRWLTTAMDDLDIPEDHYTVIFSVKPSEADPVLKKIVAEAVFSTATEVRYEGQQYFFQPEDSFELFYSNRYRPGLVEKHGRQAGLDFYRRQLVASGEEGVWLGSKRLQTSEHSGA